MDARIGQLNSGKFYAYIDGYNAEPFIGTLEEVQVALGLHKTPTARKVYTITIRFQYPAWDEVDGIEYAGIVAGSKSEAIAKVRKMALHDGHLGRAKGRAWLTATIEKIKVDSA